MGSYDGIDSNAFMNSNSHYRMQAYMVQPFFEDGEGESLPDHPTMKFVPLANEADVLAGYKDRMAVLRGRKHRKKLKNIGGRGRTTYEKRNINNKETSQ